MNITLKPKTISGKTLYFLPSNTIKVFPCANRGVDDNSTYIDVESKLLTEYNYTHLAGNLKVDNKVIDSYIVEYDDKTRFYLKKYYFEIDGNLLTALTSIGVTEYYLNIGLQEYNLIEGSTTEKSIRLINRYNDTITNVGAKETLDTKENGTYYFGGLFITAGMKYSDTSSSSVNYYSLQFTNNMSPTICTDSLMPSIVSGTDEMYEKKLIAGTGITLSTPNEYGQRTITNSSTGPDAYIKTVTANNTDASSKATAGIKVKNQANTESVLNVVEGTYSGSEWTNLKIGNVTKSLPTGGEAPSEFLVKINNENTSKIGGGSSVIVPITAVPNSGEEQLIVEGTFDNNTDKWTKLKLGDTEKDLPEYTLPKAASNRLGGIKVGSGLSIDSSGTLSAAGDSNIFIATYNVTSSSDIKAAFMSKKQIFCQYPNSAMPIYYPLTNAQLALDTFIFTIPYRQTSSSSDVYLESIICSSTGWTAKEDKLNEGGSSPTTYVESIDTESGDDAEQGYYSNVDASYYDSTHPIAQITTIINGTSTDDSEDGYWDKITIGDMTRNVGSSYVLKPATTKSLGGVKVSYGLNINSSGDLALNYAGGTTLGGIKVGSGLSMNSSSGVLSVKDVSNVNLTLPTAQMSYGWETDSTKYTKTRTTHNPSSLYTALYSESDATGLFEFTLKQRAYTSTTSNQNTIPIIMFRTRLSPTMFTDWGADSEVGRLDGQTGWSSGAICIPIQVGFILDYDKLAVSPSITPLDAVCNHFAERAVIRAYRLVSEEGAIDYRYAYALKFLGKADSTSNTTWMQIELGNIIGRTTSPSAGCVETNLYCLKIMD